MSVALRKQNCMCIGCHSIDCTSRVSNVEFLFTERWVSDKFTDDSSIVVKFVVPALILLYVPIVKYHFKV